MKKLHFEIFINAKPEKVWDTVINKESYVEWTRAFSPTPDSTSTYVGGWNKGDAIKFIGSGDEDGKESGMLSEIAESRKPEFISIRHLGMINNGVEDTTSDQVRPWIGAHENYTFTEVDGGTKFEADTDTAEEYEEMFSDAWPKALEKLKEMVEK
jgi:uncharacterized protein YndB with AHSA1/START domain